MLLVGRLGNISVVDMSDYRNNVSLNFGLEYRYIRRKNPLLPPLLLLNQPFLKLLFLSLPSELTISKYAQVSVFACYKKHQYQIKALRSALC